MTRDGGEDTGGKGEPMMVRFYTRRRITGWYTDELGRRRPITTKFYVIELPEIARIIEMREKIREKWRNVEAVLDIRLTLRNMDLKLFMETFPETKIVETRKDEFGLEYNVIELYGVRFIANEYEIKEENTGA